MIGLGGGVAAVVLGGYPRSATLLMIVPYYFAVLSAETYVVARLMLARDAAARSNASSGTSRAKDIDAQHDNR